VIDYGATSDGTTKAGGAFRAAVAACVEAGGGTVYVPPGTYLTEPIHLASNVTLYLEAGATLRFSQDPDDYPIVFTRWAGFECHAYSPCVFADGADHVSIRGDGILDGQGESWWNEFKELKAGRRPVRERDAEFAEKNAGIGGVWDEWDSQFLRPPLVQFRECTNVRIEGTTHRNSPFWNTHILYCRGVIVNGVTFENPADAPNADGLDIDSSRDVRVENCLFDVGDDCLCLKSGMNEDGRRVGRPCENVVVSNCIMRHGHGAIVCGSDSAGGIRKLVVSNCIFHGTERGFRVKSNRQRGGFVEDVTIANVVMDGVDCPLVVNAYYVCGVSEADAPRVLGREEQPVTAATPRLRNLRMSNVVARDARYAGFVAGLPEAPVDGLVVDGYRVELGGRPDEATPPASLMSSMIPSSALYLANVSNSRFNGLEVERASALPVEVENATALSFSSLRIDGAADDGTQVAIRDSAERSVRIDWADGSDGGSGTVVRGSAAR
jgi:polygalacturonase